MGGKNITAWEAMLALAGLPCALREGISQVTECEFPPID